MTEEQKATNKKTQQSEIGDEQDQAQKVEVKERQDAFVVLSLDKDVRNAETVKLKAASYTGIAVRIKTPSQANMEAIVKGIDLDARRQALEDEDEMDLNRLCLVNLRFEEV